MCWFSVPLFLHYFGLLPHASSVFMKILVIAEKNYHNLSPTLQTGILGMGFVLMKCLERQYQGGMAPWLGLAQAHTGTITEDYKWKTDTWRAFDPLWVCLLDSILLVHLWKLNPRECRASYKEYKRINSFEMFVQIFTYHCNVQQLLSL